MRCAMGKLRRNYFNNSVCAVVLSQNEDCWRSTDSKTVFNFLLGKSLVAGNHCQTFWKKFFYKEFSFQIFIFISTMKELSALILSTLFIALKMTLMKTDFKIDFFKRLWIIINLAYSRLLFQQLGNWCFIFFTTVGPRDKRGRHV